MSIGRVCSREVFLAEPDEPVFRAAERMKDRNVGTLVVLDSSKRPIGILTDRDITIRAVAPRRDTALTDVAEIMTRNPKAVSESTPIEDVLRLMASDGFRRVPVVDDAGRLVGLAALDDLFDLFSEEFISIRKLLHSEPDGRRPKTNWLPSLPEPGAPRAARPPFRP